jgi:hypothetical protein
MQSQRHLRRGGLFGLLVAGLLAFGAPAQAGIDAFPGHWRNVDSHTNNLTRVNIEPAGFGMVKVRGWGQCQPTDCDWGAVDGQFEPGGGGTVHAVFNSGFSITKLDLFNAPGQRLSYQMHVKFTDHSGRAPYDVGGMLERDGMGGGMMGGGGMGGGGMMGGGHPHFEDLAGIWHNIDPHTNNLTRVKLEPMAFPDIRVHGWGQCHPTDCDWGGEMGQFEPGGGGTVHVTFHSGFSITKLDLNRDPGDKLSYTMHVKFTDNSGRAPYEVSGWLVR